MNWCRQNSKGISHCINTVAPVCLGEYSPSAVQFSSVAQLGLTLCDPMNCSTPDLPVHHQILEHTQTHGHCIGDAILPYHPVIPLSSCLLSFPASWSFQMGQLFASGGQSIGVPAHLQEIHPRSLDSRQGPRAKRAGSGHFWPTP